MLIFATAAALRLTEEWGLSYAELIPYATPGFIAFGVCAIPAGWLADKWSRDGMIAIFFVGIGVSSLLAGLSNTPMQMGFSLALVGVFAAIYHPVGLAMVVEGRVKTGIPLAINGICGNMGVASAALLTGIMIDTAGWRTAFGLSGLISICVGFGFIAFLRRARYANNQNDDAFNPNGVSTNSLEHLSRSSMLRVVAVIFFTTALGGLIFQSTTFALPKVFDERLTDLTGSAAKVGWYAFIVFSVAAFAQLVVGYLVDKFPLRTVFACVAVLQAVFFASMIQLDGWAALGMSMAFMLVVFGQIPINDVLVGRLAKSEWRSRAYALRYVVTFSVMASAVPLIAWIHGQWGFERLFQLLASIAVLIFLSVLILPGLKRQPVMGGGIATSTAGN